MEVGVNRSELHDGDRPRKLVCCRRTDPVRTCKLGASDAAKFIAVSGVNPLWVLLWVSSLGSSYGRLCPRRGHSMSRMNRALTTKLKAQILPASAIRGDGRQRPDGA